MCVHVGGHSWCPKHQPRQAKTAVLRKGRWQAWKPPSACLAFAGICQAGQSHPLRLGLPPLAWPQAEASWELPSWRQAPLLLGEEWPIGRSAHRRACAQPRAVTAPSAEVKLPFWLAGLPLLGHMGPSPLLAVETVSAGARFCCTLHAASQLRYGPLSNCWACKGWPEISVPDRTCPRAPLR